MARDLIGSGTYPKPYLLRESPYLQKVVEVPMISLALLDLYLFVGITPSDHPTIVNRKHQLQVSLAGGAKLHRNLPQTVIIFNILRFLGQISNIR